MNWRTDLESYQHRDRFSPVGFHRQSDEVVDSNLPKLPRHFGL
jgi:hypothetical protein